MRQILVECSDPGLVVTLEEEIEHVLRNVDFEGALRLQSKLAELAHELGGNFEEMWSGFHMEVANDGDGFPPSFGSRSQVDEKNLKELLGRAEETGIGKFSARRTSLLPQGGPTPETREQFIKDLADAIRFSTVYEVEIYQRPLSFPEAMEKHRRRLLEEYAYPDLGRMAAHPLVGHKWVRDSIERLRKSLEEVDTRAQAVMEYELSRLDPAPLALEEKVHWAVLACTMGKEVAKWCSACEKELPYPYRRAALISELWTSCRGVGPARPFLDASFKALIEEASSLYTNDGREALSRIYDELRRSPWDLWKGLRDEQAENTAHDASDEADVQTHGD